MFPSIDEQAADLHDALKQHLSQLDALRKRMDRLAQDSRATRKEQDDLESAASKLELARHQITNTLYHLRKVGHDHLEVRER